MMSIPDLTGTRGQGCQIDVGLMGVAVLLEKVMEKRLGDLRSLDTKVTACETRSPPHISMLFSYSIHADKYNDGIFDEFGSCQTARPLAETGGKCRLNDQKPPLRRHRRAAQPDTRENG